MQLKELNVYQLAMDVGESVWAIVGKWDFFAKDTVGKQLVKAADSIAANISEGFGRFHYKENRQFCYYSRGSLFETRTWLNKSLHRQLISNTNFEVLENKLNLLGRRLNTYITSIGKIPQPSNQMATDK